jgi:hypothetical protein
MVQPVSSAPGPNSPEPPSLGTIWLRPTTPEASVLL